MKKFLILAAAAIAALSACTKADIEVPETEIATAPVFTASIESDATTKTTLGTGTAANKKKVNWENGDEVFMYFASSKTRTIYKYQATPNAGDASKATLSIKEGKFDESLIYLTQAFYPYSLFTGGQLHFPATQVYNGDKLGNVPLSYKTTDLKMPSTIQFRNPCALLAINVPHSVLSSVKSIKVSSDRIMNGGSKFSDDGSVLQIEKYNKTPAAGENCITLDCYSKTGANVQIPEGGSKTFYVAIPAPSSYSDSNYGYSYLQIDVTDGETTETLRTKSSGITVERNKIYNIGFLSDLCFTAKQAGSSVGIIKALAEKADIVFQYTTNNGATWIDYTPTGAETEVTLANVNDKVYFRRKDNTGGNLKGFIFTGNGNVAVSGSIMSLLSSNGSVNTLPNEAFAELFFNNKAISDASGLSLPATTLASDCYWHMFGGCESLQSAPALPATTLASNCYKEMFINCVKLQSAPALPATTLASGCYEEMFRECFALKSAPALPATTLAEKCYQKMFASCEYLESASDLPATTLASSCYKGMFDKCEHLQSAPALPATTLAENCYEIMFNGCGRLELVEIYATAYAYTESALSDWLGTRDAECYAGKYLLGASNEPIIRIKQELLNIFMAAGLTLDEDNIVTSGSYSTIPKGWKVEIL